jgi:hypothetical protein
MSTNNRIIVMLFIGMAWTFIGLGYSVLQFNYLPDGIELIAKTSGLMVAGMVSGFLFMVVRGVFNTSFSTGLVSVGYFLFAPIGIMIALLAPAPFEAAGGTTSMAFLFIIPLVTTLYSNTAVAAGLGITGGLAKSAKSISDHFEMV